MFFKRIKNDIREILLWFNFLISFFKQLSQDKMCQVYFECYLWTQREESFQKTRKTSEASTFFPVDSQVASFLPPPLQTGLICS